MSEDMRRNHEPWGSRMKPALIGFSLIGGFFLIAEHRAHVLPYLPWLLLAACPLMHLFGHRRHGHCHHDGDSAGKTGSGRTARGPAANSHTAQATTGAAEFRKPDSRPTGTPPSSDHSNRHG